MREGKPVTQGSGRWRWLLVAEVLVCFAPLLSILLLGLLVLPQQLVFLFYYGEIATLPVLGVILGGLAGVVGIVDLLRKYLRSDTSKKGRTATLLCLGAGFVALGVYALPLSGSYTLVEALVFGVPMICALHVLYVTRAVLLD